MHNEQSSDTSLTLRGCMSALVVLESGALPANLLTFQMNSWSHEPVHCPYPLVVVTLRYAQNFSNVQIYENCVFTKVLGLRLECQ